jgi:pimeloyl-[acyl-carrier protein] methyl ester esterase
MTRAVLLHGWGMSAQIWSELRVQLPRDAQAPDLPGYGTADTLSPYTLDAVVERVACDVRGAGAPIDLIGWSLGGLIAMHWAAVRPHQVRRLVLLGATPRFVAADDWGHGVPPAILRIFNVELQRTPEALMRRFSALQAQGEAEADAEEIAATLYARRGHASAQALRDSLALLGESDIRTSLPRITQPTLILHGQQDAIIGVDAARWTAAQVPHACLQVLDGCGHALPLSHAAACAQWIERFLDE